MKMKSRQKNKKNNALLSMSIISCLRHNARTSATRIAEEAGIPVSTVFSRIRYMEEKGMIRGYKSLIDFKDVGFPVASSFILDNSKKTQAHLKDKGNINTLLVLSNNKLFVEAVFKSMKEFILFAEELLEHKTKIFREYHIVECLKKEGFLCNTNPTENGKISYPEHIWMYD